MDVIIRQAHPGPVVPPYQAFEEKMRDAHRYKQEEEIPWRVLVDDIPGSVHQVYGGLADPTYLIDAVGRVAFYNMWTYAPSLNSALTELLDQGGVGVVKGGVDRVPHLTPTLAHGWRALRRGLPQSYIDLELASPGLGTLLWASYQVRPLVRPLVSRAQPLPGFVRLAALAAIAGLAVLGVRSLKRR